MNQKDPLSTPGRGAARQRALWIFGALLLLAALVWAGYWVLYQRHFESTDDAYVAANIIQVTSEVAGTVTAVHADDTQSIRRGDLLVELDPADANLGVATAEAELAQAVRDVSAQFARETQLRAALAVRELVLERARHDLQRRAPLAADGAVSDEELAHARDTVAEQEAAVAAAQSELNTLVAQVRGTSAATHPQVLRAEAALRNALLALRRTRLTAPVSGTVAKRAVEVGERIAPGTSLLALVPLGEVWIEANVREVQIGRIRVGQATTIRSDAYGSDVTYHGRVAGLAAGSGSAFALLPAQNASGNWIKIVQRIPVRVSLDPEEVRAHPLRVGTSTVVRIDVSDQSGAQVGGSVSPAPASLATSEDPAIESRIRDIVTANSRNGAASGGVTGPMSAAQVAAPTLGNLNPGPRALTAFAVALATFMTVLDSTIANVTVPVVSGDLGVSTDQGTWVITSFAVANAISVPLTGWLMRRFGLVRSFVTAVALFTLASFLCGIAWNLPSLIAFRVFQGVASGPMSPGSQALLLSIFPPQKRSMALAIWSLTALVAPVVGPVMGGYISDQYSWPWIFLINVPVGILSALLCWRILGRRDTATERVPVDRMGLGLLIVWVGALQIMLDKGKDEDWFTSPVIVALAIVAAIGFVVFLIWELTEEHPIVDLTLFRSRNFRLGTIAQCIGYALFIANLLLLTLWLQTQLGYTATWAGLVAMPSGVVAVLVTPMVGRLMARIDARWFATVAMVAFGISYAMRAFLTSDASVTDFMMPQIAQGVAMGTFFIAFVAITLNGIPPERVPAASGLSLFARTSAGAFATSTVTTFWDRHAAFHQARLAEHTSAFDVPMREAVTHLQSLGLSLPQSLGLLTRTLGIQASAKAALDFFWISAWIAFALIGMIWFTRSTAGSAGRPPVAVE